MQSCKQCARKVRAQRTLSLAAAWVQEARCGLRAPIQSHLLVHRVCERHEVLYPSPILRLLQPELIVLCLEPEQAVALLEEVHVGRTQGLLQLTDLFRSLLSGAAQAVRLGRRGGACCDAPEQICSLGLEVVCMMSAG